MKNLFLTLICLALSLSAQAGLKEDCYRTIKDQGLTREYYIYIPEGLKTEGAPLVFTLHGYGGDAWDNFPDIMKCADREGFGVCFPQGAIDPNGCKAWEVGYPFQEGNKIDDVKFLAKLAKKLQKEYGFNKKATFVTGMSNGGEMCYILAYRGTDTFRAVAPIAGLQMEWAYKELKPVRPIPLLEVHGTADTISWWNGDLKNEGGWGAYLPVEIAVNNWVSIDKCTDVVVEELPLMFEGACKVVLYKYINGTDGCEVRLYKVIDGDHGHNNGYLPTIDEVWSFFKQYID